MSAAETSDTSPSVSTRSRATGWSRPSTFLVSADPDAESCQAISHSEAEQIAGLQDAHLESAGVVVTDRTVGGHGACRLGTTLVMEACIRRNRCRVGAADVSCDDIACAHRLYAGAARGRVSGRARDRRRPEAAHHADLRHGLSRRGQARRPARMGQARVGARRLGAPRGREGHGRRPPRGDRGPAGDRQVLGGVCAQRDHCSLSGRPGGLDARRHPGRRRERLLRACACRGFAPACGACPRRARQPARERGKQRPRAGGGARGPGGLQGAAQRAADGSLRADPARQKPEHPASAGATRPPHRRRPVRFRPGRTARAARRPAACARRSAAARSFH